MRDIVIVGGGLAGAAAAAALARAGERPLVLERERAAAHKICGEFLSGEAVTHLAALGLDVARLGAQPIDRMRLVAGGRSVASALPFTAAGLTRRRLDEALLETAAALGAKVERGVAARSLAGEALDTTAGELRPRALLLASGKHEVRGAKRDAPGALTGLIGFKTHFRLPPAVRAELAGHVEVVLFDGGYAGLLLAEDGIANLCLLVTRERFEAAGRRWDRLFDALLAEPHLARRLGDATPLFERPLTIADVPYGFVHRPSGAERLFRLGDQAAVIPSFAGDGMAIALHSAALAAKCVLEGGTADRYHARLRADVAGPVRLATWLQRAADGALGRGLILAALGLAPPAMALLAARTRIPRPALRRLGLAVAPAA